MEHERFLADIAAHPSDPASRFVYADWLEERGDKRADFIRLVVEVATQEAYGEAAGIELHDGLMATLEHVNMPRESWTLFAVDCAEHVLPISEKTFADEDRPRLVIEAARRLKQRMKPVVEGPAELSRNDYVSIAIIAAEDAASDEEAIMGARMAVYGSRNDGDWQLIRLAEYKLWGRAVGLWSGP
ncbi:MAG: TIGR02996 domain-containing protein [Planctomycetales bacterium]